MPNDTTPTLRPAARVLLLDGIAAATDEVFVPRSLALAACAVAGRGCPAAAD